jgi:hypothetical protein
LLASVVFQAICEGMLGSSPGKRLFSTTVLAVEWVRHGSGRLHILSMHFFPGWSVISNMQKIPRQ